MKTLNDKQLVEKLLPVFLLGIIAAYGVNKDNEKLMQINKDFFQKKCKENYKDPAKIARRCHWAVFNCFGVMIDKKMINSRKLIIVLYNVVTLLNEEGHEFDSELENIFEPFLEMEKNQDEAEGTTLEEWEKLKKSSDKLAKKVIDKLKGNNYYLTS